MTQTRRLSVWVWAIIVIAVALSALSFVAMALGAVLYIFGSHP